MGLWDYFFGEEKKKDTRKRVFISFAIEDSQSRTHLVQQGKNNRSPFNFIDMSVKQPWAEKVWQEKCRTKIKKCHGVIVLLSSNTYHSSGTRWEITCAKQEKIPIIGMHIRKNDKFTIPPELKGKRVIEWSWKNIETFINTL